MPTARSTNARGTTASRSDARGCLSTLLPNRSNADRDDLPPSSARPSELMKSILARLLIVVLAASLSACDLDVPPILSANCTTYVAGSPGPQKELTSVQLHALSTWLSEHRSNWSRTATTHAPGTLIWIRHQAGETSSLNLWPRLLVASGPFGQYQRVLTEDEARALTQILDPVR